MKVQYFLSIPHSIVIVFESKILLRKEFWKKSTVRADVKFPTLWASRFFFKRTSAGILYCNVMSLNCSSVWLTPDDDTAAAAGAAVAPP